MGDRPSSAGNGLGHMTRPGAECLIHLGAIRSGYLRERFHLRQGYVTGLSGHRRSVRSLSCRPIRYSPHDGATAERINRA